MGSKTAQPALLVVLAVLVLSAALLISSLLGSLPHQLEINSAALVRPDSTPWERIREFYGKLPLSFEPNQGQTDAQIRFFARGQGYTLFLAPTEAILALTTPGRHSAAGCQTQARPESPTRAGTTLLRMRFVGANPTPRMEGLDELPGKSHYLLGRDPQNWRTDAPTYARVQYQDLYSRVDLVYHGKEQVLEYDFVLAPGANPHDIRLAFEGATNLFVDARGDLVLCTSGGEVRYHQPIVYQEMDDGRQQVSGNYVLNDNHHVGFHVAAYDVSRPLIIDPRLHHSTYLGGNGHDEGRSIAIDVHGNVYVTGQSSSTDFPLRNDIQSDQNATDIFVTKLNSTLSKVLYSTYLGGSGLDQGLGIAIDGEGNAYITGQTNSEDFPKPPGACLDECPVQGTYGGGVTDVFVARLAPSGSALVFSTYLGGSGQDRGDAIALDASGNAYLTGETFSGNFPLKNPILNDQPGSDAFVTKVNAFGSRLVYSTYHGGDAFDAGSDIAVDASGSAYVTGTTSSSDFPLEAPLQNNQPGRDAFVTRVKADGTGYDYSTYLGGDTPLETGRGIALDGSGNAYVTGSTASLNFPTTTGAFDATCGEAGFAGVYVTKLSNTGTLLYSTCLGGTDNADLPNDVAVDADGNAYITGIAFSISFPTTPDAFDKSCGTDGLCNGNQDAFLTIVNPTGSGLVFSSYLGGSDSDGDEAGYSITLDSDGNAYLTGVTGSVDFPTTTLTLDPSCGTGTAIPCNNATDAFIVRVGGGLVLPPLPPFLVDGVVAWGVFLTLSVIVASLAYLGLRLRRRRAREARAHGTAP